MGGNLDGVPLADWANRVLAYLVDGLVILPLYIVANIFLQMGTFGALVAILLELAMIGVIIYNRIREGQTGQTVGKRVLGLALVGEGDQRPIGGGRAVVRSFAHIVECGIGWLFPLWDVKRQTFADKLMGTVVRSDAPKMPFMDAVKATFMPEK